MAQNDIALNLDEQEALVLFEWLHLLESLGAKAIQHPSEERVLWKLQGQLEKALPVLFVDNYAELLAAARRAVEARDE